MMQARTDDRSRQELPTETETRQSTTNENPAAEAEKKESDLIARLVNGVHDLPGPNLAYEVLPGYALVKDTHHSQRVAEVNTSPPHSWQGDETAVEQGLYWVAAYRPWESDNYETRSHASLGDALEDIAGILYEYRQPGSADQD